MGEINLITENGLVMQNLEKYRAIKKYYRLDQSLLRRETSDDLKKYNYWWHNEWIPDDAFVTFNILPSNKKIEIKRTYMKLIDVVALVGGVMQAMFVCVTILYGLFNLNRLQKHLI